MGGVIEKTIRCHYTHQQRMMKKIREKRKKRPEKRTRERGQKKKKPRDSGNIGAGGKDPLWGGGAD